ncbi:spermatogenesis associated 6-like protein [Electrophorus electricus]|uniref:spermatogenesis associated 6-like protein n=1 Tax=Electrophorus electricus TaxID=8005 RepID=UPI000F09B53C|nr:spermatogenesis associated 6-like protein [Electrophorus electricus]
MSQKGLKVVVELHLRAITCPGVHLPAKDDIYLSLRLMSQYKKSECLPAVFPLLLRMKMRFEKIFKYAIDPAAVAEILQCETVKVELIQLIPPAGYVLASYEEDARSFLFPEPKLIPSFSGGGREVLMTRDPSFPGISPRLEFSTRTTISECSERDTFQSAPVRVMTRKSAKKPRSQGHSCHHSSASWRHEGLWSTGREREVPSSRSLSPFLSAGSNKINSSPQTHRQRKDSWSRDTSHCSPGRSSRIRSPSPHDSTVESGNIRRSHSSPLVPNDGSSSDTDDHLYSSEDLGQRTSLLGCERSSNTAKHSNMTSPKTNSPLSCATNAWEEVQERVQSLLTSPNAVHRLAYGATEDEIDEVLARRSISYTLSQEKKHLSKKKT